MTESGAGIGDGILRQIVCGGGNFWPFLTTSFQRTLSSPEGDGGGNNFSHGSQSGPASYMRQDLLIEPFKSSMGDDGQLSLCRLAEVDNWDKAMATLKKQVSNFGGPDLRWHGLEAGLVVDGVQLFRRKKVLCSRQGIWQPKTKKPTCPHPPPDTTTASQPPRSSQSKRVS